MLTADERERAKNVHMFIVWYEDRFGFAADRDPAFPVAYHYTREAAEADAASRGGPPYGKQGKFDGYEVGNHGTLLEAYEKGFVTDEEARALLTRS